MSDVIRCEKKIPGEKKYLSEVRDFVREIVDISPFLEKDKNLICVAVDEAIANIMEHAYEGREEGQEPILIGMSVELLPERLVVLINDSGNKFDPTTVAMPDIQEHIKSGKKRGLGIFLMRQIMDEVHYSYKQGVENELKMVKYIKK